MPNGHVRIADPPRRDWTHCYHITAASNLESIRATRKLETALSLLRAGGRSELGSARRTRDEVVSVIAPRSRGSWLRTKIS